MFVMGSQLFSDKILEMDSDVAFDVILDNFEDWMNCED